MQKEIIDKVRETIYSERGKRIRIKINRGRHRIDISEGIIKEAYPSVFIVELDKKPDEAKPKTLSFSYIDVATKEVQMMLVQE